PPENQTSYCESGSVESAGCAPRSHGSIEPTPLPSTAPKPTSPPASPSAQNHSYPQLSPSSNLLSSPTDQSKTEQPRSTKYAIPTPLANQHSAIRNQQSPSHVSDMQHDPIPHPVIASNRRKAHLPTRHPLLGA